MLRYYIIIAVVLLLSGCKEIYDPDINRDKTALVIQGLMTNVRGQLSVRISQAVPYDSTMSQKPVHGASVQITDDHGNVFQLHDNGSGRYENDEAVAVPGYSYILRVETPDGEVYESGSQVMPQPYNQDSIYAEIVSHNVFVPSSDGDYFQVVKTGIETYVDLSSGSTEIPKCRYETMVTVLYVYDGDGFPPPTVYCWKTFSTNSGININEIRFDKTSGFTPKHVLNFFGTNIKYYDERDLDFTVYGWLLNVSKLSLSAATHKYYSDIKKQLEASGKIFDPMPSQLSGNIKCINHPEKLAFGFFEVSFQENLYYRYKTGQRIISLLARDQFPGFTKEGESVGIPPAFWSY